MCNLVDGKHYSVTSPGFDYTEIVCEYGGPTYTVHDWALVIAKNKREAKTIAVRGRPEDLIDGDLYTWVSDSRGDNMNPFSGLTVEECDCGHGYCWGCYEDVTMECKECRAYCERDDYQLA